MSLERAKRTFGYKDDFVVKSNNGNDMSYRGEVYRVRGTVPGGVYGKCIHSNQQSNLNLVTFFAYNGFSFYFPEDRGVKATKDGVEVGQYFTVKYIETGVTGCCLYKCVATNDEAIVATTTNSKTHVVIDRAKWTITIVENYVE